MAVAAARLSCVRTIVISKLPTVRHKVFAGVTLNSWIA